MGGGHAGALVLPFSTVVLLLAAGCGGSGQSGSEAAGGGGESGGKPPIVLVSIDTLRADHLPAYGYAGVETPAIDRLRNDGILFRDASSPMPLTLPAHSSMLTGLLPPTHGVRDNMGYSLDGADLPSLARRLGELGYATGAAISSFVLRSGTGIEAGFDTFEDSIDYRAGVGAAGLQRPGGETLEAALPWLRSAAAGGPFFFFLHLYEPHTPYAPPEPFASAYTSAYDGEIAAADAVVGRLLEELEALGVYEGAVVVLTSDHGEGLGDHGEEEHGIFLYRETLHVPMILKLPGSRRAGTEVTAPAQLVDILPTLVELAGGEPPEGLPGTSLLRLEDLPMGERRIYAETYFPRLYFGWSDLTSLYDGRFQYIESPAPELYDLTADPGETENVLEGNRRVAAGLRRELAGLTSDFQAPAVVDLETWQSLASLGYVGSGRVTAEGPLPPPHLQKHLLARLEEALAAATAHRHGEAVELFQAVLEENPAMLVAWEQLARSQVALGHLEEAADAYDHALELSGGAPHLALASADVLLRLGRLPQARERARQALSWHEAAARELLARAALASGDPAAAETEARTVLALEPGRLVPLVTLARVERERGDLKAALEWTDKAVATADGRPVRGLFDLKGDLLARLGRSEAAEAALRREVELFPRDPGAYSHLALLLALEGRGDESAEVLRRQLAADPTAAGYASVVETLRVLGDPRAAAALLAEARRRFPDSPELEELADG